MDTAPTHRRPPADVEAAVVPGARVGHFELVRELGRGGMGVVYLARDTRLGRKVAIKFLAAVDPALLARFLTEARATASCTHENIVQIYEVGDHGGMPFMVLEYINGKSLSDFVGDRRLTAHQACELLLPVVRALVRAHQAGIIHRDLKPSNILVSARGVVKVLDFGIAKFFTAEDPPSASARMNTARDFDTFESDGTADGAIVGTVPFMSPEQWGVDAIDARSDQWAIGVIFWRLVARVHPVGSLERSAIMQAVRDLEQPLRALDQVVSDCPPKFAAIVARCLAKRRADRYPDCEALLTELEGFLRGGRDGAVVGPYVGLDSFRETDAGRYFGRSAEVRTAVATLRDHPLLAVVGGSGAGKSSFVFAGVVPALRGERSLEVLSLRPGRRPLAALTAAVASVAPDLDEAKLITAPGRLGLALRHAAGDAKAWRVIVVDQFEELFTHEVGVDERRAFIAALLGAADDAHVPIRVIITLRSDYLEQVATDEALLVEVTRGLSFLPPLDREATREALVAPARDRGFDFEPGLADDMVRELEGTQVPLPLLQFAAACLWDRRDHDRHRLTRAAYEAIGGVVGAFAVHGDRVLAGLPPSSQAIARAIFVRLVSPERTRAVVDRDDLTGLAPAADVERVLAHLVAGRLIHVHTAPDVAATVELVHEALITEWPVLVRWLDESGAVAAFVHEVRNAARQWHGRGRPIGLLWSGAIARDAAAQARWAHGLLSAIEEDFLDQVAHHARREARRRRIAVASALVVLSAIAIVVVVALFRVRSAERLAVRRASQAETAERETARQLDVINQERAQRSAAERAADEAARAATAAEKVAEEAAQAQRQSTELSRAELAAANARLTAALATARAERDKADRMNDELQRYLRDERERVRKLQAERNKVIQKLD